MGADHRHLGLQNSDSSLFLRAGLNDEPRGLDTLVDLSAHLNHEDNEPTHLPDRDTAPSSSGMVNPVLSGGSEPRARTRSRSGSTALRSSLNRYSITDLIPAQYPILAFIVPLRQLFRILSSTSSSSGTLRGGASSECVLAWLT